MQLTTQQLHLTLENPFKVSYGASTVRDNVLVHISDGTHQGVGEAAVVPYYPATAQSIIDDVTDPDVIDHLSGELSSLDDMLGTMPPMIANAAKNAVDIALHDLWGKQLGQPLYRLFGLNPQKLPMNSYTVGMADDEADYRRMLQAAKQYPLIKLKLGSGTVENDMALVEIALDELSTDHQFCVDANGAWSAEDTMTTVPELAKLGILFIEQPVAKDDWGGWQMLKTYLPDDMPPLIADESVQGLESLHQLIGLVDGVNIKLAKCGGIRQARKMIEVARFHGLEILLGCMIESSVAITAAAHLAPLVDFLDLDGNLLITNDPYEGVIANNGQLTLPTQHGIGVTRK